MKDDINMANVYVYNDRNDSMEYYTLGETDAMPYNIGRTLTVGDFRGSSRAGTLWTSRRAMEAFNVTRNLWGRPIYVDLFTRQIVRLYLQ